MNLFFSIITLSLIGFSAISDASAQVTMSSDDEPSSVIKESKIILNLSENGTVYDNRVDVDFDTSENPVVIYGIEKEGSYIQTLDKNWEPNSSKIVLSGIYFLDFLVVNGDYYVLGKETAEYSGAGPLDYEEEGNILVFLKVDSNGRIIYKRQLFGHEGTHGGQYFLCTYSSHGELVYDGKYFHAMVETCGNFTAQGSPEFDIHEGDYYLTFDIEGIVRENGRSAWNHSHSSLLHAISTGIGKCVTITVGDSYPFGISVTRFTDGEKVSDRVIYPDQTSLAYNDMYAASKSSTDAGEIGGIVQVGEYLYTVIATVPEKDLPVLNQKKDLLFIKMDLNGNEVMRRWIKTPDQDESVPFIIEQHGALFMAFMYKTGEYDYDYRATIALLNTEGDYLLTPQKTDYFLNFQSRLTKLPDGEIALVSAEAYSTQAETVRFELMNIPTLTTTPPAPTRSNTPTAPIRSRSQSKPPLKGAK